MVKVSSGTFVQTVSDFEEQVWLLQQQNPERVLQHIASWQLCDSINIANLFEAIQCLIQNVPDLNARYNLSDEGGLIKCNPQNRYDCIEFLSATTHSALVEHILTRQAASWNSENDAPFKALIIRHDDQFTLSLILHDILAPMANMPNIVRFLQCVCAGEQPVPFVLKRPPLLPFAEQYPSPVPGLRRFPGVRAIIRSGMGNGSEWNERALAMRWRTTVCAEGMSMLSAGEATREAILSGIVLRFARFISQLSGQSDLALCLLLEDGPHYLIINTTDVGAQLAATIEETLRSPVESEELSDVDTTAPWIYVRLLPEVSEQNGEQPWPGLPVLLPTCETSPDIELALSLSAERTLTLTLTLGQPVYSSLGEYVLDRLVLWLQGNEGSAIDVVHAAHELPHGSETEADVDRYTAAILSEFRAALNAPDMTTTEDFFDYGGHSLLATRVIGRLLSTHGLEVHFGDFFSYPSAAALAPHAVRIDKPESSVETHPLSDSNVSAPLALAQSSLWEAYKAYDFGTIFNLPFALDLLDTVDEALLEKALGDIIERHTSLRSLFMESDGEARQQVIEMAQLADYTWFWRSDQSQSVTLKDEAVYRFNLAQELPLRVRVLHNPATGRQALSLLVHHMAIDEWSLNVIMEELTYAYASRAEGNAPVWQKPALPFHAFALCQRAEGVNQQHLAYWHQMLRDATRGLSLAVSNEGAVTAEGENSSAAGWLEYSSRPDVTQGLYALARQSNASLFTVMYTAIALALHKLGDLSDIAIGTSASGRTHQETYETVGYFTTMVAHRVKFDPSQSVKALITHVRDTINDSMQYADIPLDIIQKSLGISPEEGLLFDVYIQIHASNALNGALNTLSGHPVRYRQIDPDKTESMFGLQFEIMEDVIEGEKSVRLVITYRAGRYPESLVKRISAAIDATLTFFTTPASLNTSVAEVSL